MNFWEFTIDTSDVVFNLSEVSLLLSEYCESKIGNVLNDPHKKYRLHIRRLR